MAGADLRHGARRLRPLRQELCGSSKPAGLGSDVLKSGSPKPFLFFYFYFFSFFFPPCFSLSQLGKGTLKRHHAPICSLGSGQVIYFTSPAEVLFEEGGLKPSRDGLVAELWKECDLNTPNSPNQP